MARDCAGLAGRVDTGRCGYHAGLAAEDGVAVDYARRGYPLLARRWRGRSGEIDLVLGDGDGVVVVEVKKSRSFDRAAERLSQRQIGRLLRAGEEFLGTMPRGSLTDIRFDVALVNGQGEIRVIENALC
ncbi:MULTISPECIES: YraN family protein [unclassified Mameliella]|uniref:YraN family protein n=1 Tax=unclassified Mameliella TaxID=2630630 RepID=UPI00273F8EAB|nr:MULTISPECIES: YraN family protein [unclassified Mameliella]